MVRVRLSLWRVLIIASSALLALGCSNDEDDGVDGSVALEGSSCVDPNDACCCESELEVAAPGGSSTCRYGFLGDPQEYTFELVSPRSVAVLTRVDSEAACGSDGGWYPTSSGDNQYADLCPATCSRLGVEQGRIRALLGCPIDPC